MEETIFENLALDVISRAMTLTGVDSRQTSGSLSICYAKNKKDDSQLKIPFFCFGKEAIDIILMERYISKMIKETSPGQSRLLKNSYSIVGMREGNFFSVFQSTLGPLWDEAIAVVYGMAHRLSEVSKVQDIIFSKKIISWAESWQRQNSPENELIVRLAQEVFPPQVLS